MSEITNAFEKREGVMPWLIVSFQEFLFFFVNLQCLHILPRIMFFLYGLPYLAWEMKSLLKAFRSKKKIPRRKHDEHIHHT